MPMPWTNRPDPFPSISRLEVLPIGQIRRENPLSESQLASREVFSAALLDPDRHPRCRLNSRCTRKKPSSVALPSAVLP